VRDVRLLIALLFVAFANQQIRNGSLVLRTPCGKAGVEPRRVELREDLEQVDPKSCVTPETSKGNEAAAGSRINPKTTRKSPT